MYIHWDLTNACSCWIQTSQAIYSTITFTWESSRLSLPSHLCPGSPEATHVHIFFHQRLVSPVAEFHASGIRFLLDIINMTYSRTQLEGLRDNLIPSGLHWCWNTHLILLPFRLATWCSSGTCHSLWDGWKRHATIHWSQRKMEIIG